MKLNKLNFSLSLETLNGPVHELSELKEYFNIIQKNKIFLVRLLGLVNLKTGISTKKRTLHMKQINFLR